MSDSRTGRRRGKNNVQETKSLGQVMAALSEWLPNRLSEDFGEDMIVQIEDDGEWTGLSFFLQAKSNTDLVGTKLKRLPAYSYSLDVKDILRWELASPPVVVVVWDVKASSGIWVDVPAAVKRLDAENKKWRQQQKASVHFPEENRLDQDAGQARLRRRLADLAIPAIGKGKTLTINPTFQFPKDSDAQELFRELMKTIEEGGEAVTIPGKYVKAFRLSEWWERLYGSADIAQLTIGPSSSEQSLNLELVAIGPERAHTMPLTLPRTRGGIRKVTYSNADTPDPVKVTLVLPGAHAEDAEALDATISVSFPARDASGTANLVSFLLAFRDAGACRIRHRESGIEIGEAESTLLSNLPEDDELLAWERLAQKLLFVETTVSKFGRFDLSNGVTDEDLVVLDRLYAMCRGEPWEVIGSFAYTLEPHAEVPDDLSVEVRMCPEFFGTWQLLGVSIPLKTVEIIVVDSKQFLLAMKDAIEGGHSRVEVEDIRLAHELISWGEPER